MKKSELRQIIREEIQALNEGGDWIKLKGLPKDIEMDSRSGWFVNRKTDKALEPRSKNWDELYDKLNPKEKKLADKLARNDDWYGTHVVKQYGKV